MGELYTDNANNDDNDADDDDDGNDANDKRWTNHDCIGSLPNEPKNKNITLTSCIISDVSSRMSNFWREFSVN